MVHNPAIPVVGRQPGKDVGEQPGGIRELAGHILGLLVGISVVQNPFVPPQRGAVRPIHPAGGKHPFALHQQHVPQMAAIFQWRPHVGPASRSQVDLAAAENRHHLGDSLRDLPDSGRRLAQVVGEAAFRAAIQHAVIVPVTGTVPVQGPGSGPAIRRLEGSSMSAKDHPNNAPGVPMVYPTWFENIQVKYLNPALKPIARYLPGTATIEHRGRKSGRPYKTIVTTYRKGAVLAIALGHGKTDWVKNVLAAGEADVHYARRTVHITNPRILPAGSDGSELPWLVRLQLRRMAVFLADIA